MCWTHYKYYHWTCNTCFLNQFSTGKISRTIVCSFFNSYHSFPPHSNTYRVVHTCNRCIVTTTSKMLSMQLCHNLSIKYDAYLSPNASLKLIPPFFCFSRCTTSVDSRLRWHRGNTHKWTTCMQSHLAKGKTSEQWPFTSFYPSSRYKIATLI